MSIAASTYLNLLTPNLTYFNLLPLFLLPILRYLNLLQKTEFLHTSKYSNLLREAVSEEVPVKITTPLNMDSYHPSTHS